VARVRNTATPETTNSYVKERTRVTRLLLCIDFPEMYLKRSKSNPDKPPRKCCFFDVNGNCSENARIMPKSDQQTVTKSFSVKPIICI